MAVPKMKSEIPGNTNESTDIADSQPEVEAAEVKKPLSEIEKAMPEIVQIKERGLQAKHDLLEGIVSFFQSFDSSKKPDDMEIQTFEAMAQIKDRVLRAYKTGNGVDHFTIGYSNSGDDSLRLGSTAVHDFCDTYLHRTPETFVDEAIARDFRRAECWRVAGDDAEKYFRGGDTWGRACEHNPAKAREILDKVLEEFPL